MKFLLIILPLPLLVIGCDSKDDDLDDTAVDDTTSEVSNLLAGHDFIMTEIEGFEPATDISLYFEQRRVRTGGGCNSIDARYTLEDDILMIRSIGITYKYCNEELHAQDGWLWNLLRAEPKLTYEPPILTLQTETVSMTLLDREIALPDMSLIGVEWVMNSAIDSNGLWAGNVSVDPTWFFSEDGSVVVNTGCNHGNGSYTLSGDTLTLSEMTWTPKDCLNEIQQQADEAARWVLDDGETSVEIDESTLTLMRRRSGVMAQAAEK